MTVSDIAARLDTLISAYEADPARGPANYPPATARIRDGLKCRVTGPGGEVLETDMVRDMGGEGAAPNPGWTFRATLASCCATMIASRAARLGIVLTDLEVRVSGTGNVRGMLGLNDKISAGHATIRTDVRISSDNATPEQLRELVQWANDHSPVGCTVRDAPPQTVEVEVV